VIANVDGKARKPNGTALKAHLEQLAPRVSLRGSGTQSLDAAIEIRVRCQAACRARATGQLLVGSAALRLTAASRSLPAGRTRTLSPGIGRETRQVAAAALRQGEPVSARLTVVVSNGSHSRRKRSTVRLRLG
jgi:hypothetical protein